MDVIAQDEDIRKNVSLLQNGTELYFPVINRKFRLKSIHHSWTTIISSFIIVVILIILFCCCLNNILPILYAKLCCPTGRNCCKDANQKAPILLTPVRLRQQQTDIARELPMAPAFNDAFESLEV